MKIQIRRYRPGDTDRMINTGIYRHGYRDREIRHGDIDRRYRH